MFFLNNLGLVLLTMVGYSIGRVLPGKKFKIAAELFDGAIIVVLWVGALVTDFRDKPFSIGMGLITGMIVGLLVTLVIRSTLPPADKNIPVENKKKNSFQKLWGRWKSFAFRMGNFQGRLILLLFYFSILAPFGIINRFFRDPLNLKKVNKDSYWFDLTTPAKEIEDARRQY
jgi:hypothetical protein